MENREKNRRNKVKINNKMVNLNPNTSIITLNVNYSNIPIKIQRLSQWIKNDPTI